MSAKKSAPRKELRANLLALFEDCPFDHRNPEDCPLFKLRKMKPRQRVRWFNALGEKDLSFLAAYHQVCLSTKVNAKSAN